MLDLAALYIARSPGVRLSSAFRCFCVLAVAVLLAVPAAHAQAPDSNFSPIGGTLAFADFDGDERADSALLTSSNIFRQGVVATRLELSSGESISLEFLDSLDFGHVLGARDYDDDDDIDIVIEDAFARPLLVWINHDNGHFEAVRLPVHVDTADHKRHGIVQLAPRPPTEFVSLGSRRSPAAANVDAFLRDSLPDPQESTDFCAACKAPHPAFFPAVPIRGSPFTLHAKLF